MDDEEGGKVNGIRQIVRLKELLHKWQSMTITEKENNNNNNNNNNKPPSPEDGSGHGGISPAINRRLKNSYVLCDSDEENWNSPEPPPDVPKGYLAVYVGPELRRFIIPTSYLSLPVFKLLLEKAEEEFGFDHKGGLTIPCEIETFKFLLKFMENNLKDHQDHSDAHAEGQSSSVEE